MTTSLLLCCKEVHITQQHLVRNNTREADPSWQHDHNKNSSEPAWTTTTRALPPKKWNKQVSNQTGLFLLFLSSTLQTLWKSTKSQERAFTPKKFNVNVRHLKRSQGSLQSCMQHHVDPSSRCFMEISFRSYANSPVSQILVILPQT